MKIQGYCLLVEKQDWIPAIPVAVISLGEVLGRSGNSVISEPLVRKMLGGSLELPDEHWIGVGVDGSCIIFNADDEKKWCVSQASRAIAESQDPVKVRSDPVLYANRMHAAAALVGLNVQSLMQAVESARRSPNESLESIVSRIKDQVAR